VSLAAERSRRPGLLIPSLLTLAAFSAFIALGTWQLHRKAWKEALIDTLEHRFAAAPAPLPLPAQWSSLDPDTDEFRRVTFTPAFEPGEEALVYTSGSAFRPDVSGPGYWVFAPARLPNGGVVIVDRGFVPEGRQDPKTRPSGESSGPLVGVMRWPETPGWFTPNAEPTRNLWFARDHLAIATAEGWGGRDHGGEVAPFYIEQESPQPPGGLPRPGPLTVKLPNDHLQYAITWFGLAAVLVIAFSFWLRSRAREA
jgi:surfeit locus 1 family protein